MKNILNSTADYSILNRSHDKGIVFGFVYCVNIIKTLKYY
jgi:hypothetical protein